MVGGLEGGDEGGLLFLGGFPGWEGALAIDEEAAFGSMVAWWRM